MFSRFIQFIFDVLINCIVKMKTSLLILILLALNTTAIFSEPISFFIKGVDTWILVLFEVLLLIGYVVNNILKDINKAFEIEFNGLNFYPKNNKK